MAVGALLAAKGAGEDVKIIGTDGLLGPVGTSPPRSGPSAPLFRNR
jgi:hypothetical protein